MLHNKLGFKIKNIQNLNVYVCDVPQTKLNT